MWKIGSKELLYKSVEWALKTRHERCLKDRLNHFPKHIIRGLEQPRSDYKKKMLLEIGRP